MSPHLCNHNVFYCWCHPTFAMRVLPKQDGNADRPSANNPCSDRRIDSSQWERYGGTHYYTSERGVARGYLGGTVRYSGGVWPRVCEYAAHFIRQLEFSEEYLISSLDTVKHRTNGCLYSEKEKVSSLSMFSTKASTTAAEETENLSFVSLTIILVRVISKQDSPLVLDIFVSIYVF